MRDVLTKFLICMALKTCRNGFTFDDLCNAWKSEFGEDIHPMNWKGDYEG